MYSPYKPYELPIENQETKNIPLTPFKGGIISEISILLLIKANVSAVGFYL
jgi:hypothetical protein